ncbi:carbohydrate ABC transporter permease [Agrobacterium sp. NPDC089420]|uniref:carbohydrate ABC transporter permease n=1 Tax=Agrobacterium sp. NPDC089420 TaxID=3363918 RepID=UPI0038511747
MTARNDHIMLTVGRYIPLVVLALIFIFPMVFMVMSSFKPAMQLLSDTSSIAAFLPVGHISLDNYVAAFRRAPIGLFILNSIFVTSVTVVASIFLCSLAGFSTVFIEWKGRNLVLAAIVATMIIPFEAVVIPMLLLVSKLPWIGANGLSFGWLNSYEVQIIPFIADGLTVFLFVQYFRSLPGELIEAAQVEGAGWWLIYRRVVMPLAGPVVATAAILKFLAMYNQYMWPLMVVQDEAYRPVMVGLQYFYQESVPWGEVMAYLSIITVPVLIFYTFLQRAFIASIAATGVKG